jgi:hypothetical protein
MGTQPLPVRLRWLAPPVLLREETPRRNRFPALPAALSLEAVDVAEPPMLSVETSPPRPLRALSEADVAVWEAVVPYEPDDRVTVEADDRVGEAVGAER